MEQYLDILTRFAVRNFLWIYFLCALGLIWYLAELRRARRVLGQARFSLEFETGRRLRNNALFFLLFFGGVGGSVFYLNSAVDPVVREAMLSNPVPTLSSNILRLTGTPDLTPVLLPTSELAVATVPLVPTITLAPAFLPTSPVIAVAEADPAEADGTPEPEAEETTAEEATIEPSPTFDGPTWTPAPPTPEPTTSPWDCAYPHEITAPAYQRRVSGNVNFVGSVDHLDFLYYRLEANGPNTGGLWANLLGQFIYQRVDNGLLGSANFANWVRGSYQVRLVVVDVNSVEVASCTTQIVVE